MELLYLLLGVIGLLCFYYCVKYIFRDTNKQYYYKDIYPESEKIIEHQTDIQPSPYYDFTPISDIDEFDTIIISDIDNLSQFEMGAHLGRGSAGLIEYLGIYNKISIYELTYMIHLNPIYNDSDMTVDATKSQLITNLHIEGGAKHKQDELTIYYKIPDGNLKYVKILVFTKIKGQDNYTSFITDYKVAGTKQLLYHTSVTEAKLHHINIKDENTKIYKYMIVKDVLNISKKHLYSTFRFKIKITPAHSGGKGQSKDKGKGQDKGKGKGQGKGNEHVDVSAMTTAITSGECYMYGLNKYNEMYTVTNNKYKKYNIYTQFDHKPSTIFIGDHLSNTLNGLHDRPVLNDIIHQHFPPFNYAHLDEFKAPEIISKLAGGLEGQVYVLGDYRFYKSTNNSFIYLNNNFNTYIKFTLKNEFVTTKKNTNKIKFPNIDRWDALGRAVTEAHDIEVSIVQSAIRFPGLKMGLEQNNLNYATENESLKTEGEKIQTIIKDYNSELYKYFNINIGFVIMKNYNGTPTYIDYVDNINTNQVHFADWLRIPSTSDSSEYTLVTLDKLYATQNKDPTQGAKYTQKKQPPLPTIYIQYYYENIDIEYKVYYFNPSPKPETLASIRNLVFNKIKKLRTKNISELVNEYILHEESEEEFNTSIKNKSSGEAIDIRLKKIPIETEEEEEDLIYNTSVNVSNNDDIFGFIHSKQNDRIYTLRIPSEIDSSEHYGYYRFINENISKTGTSTIPTSDGVTLYLKKNLFTLVEEEDDEHSDYNLLQGSFCKTVLKQSNNSNICR